MSAAGGSGAGGSGAEAARKRWELENNVQVRIPPGAACARAPASGQRVLAAAAPPLLRHALCRSLAVARSVCVPLPPRAHLPRSLTDFLVGAPSRPASQENDALFRYDNAEQRAIDSAKPWRADPHYFKNVKVSALALIKMAMHARSGGTLEVMGIMTGKTVGDTFIVLDCFALPVEGTETRVNAANEANEYMVEFITKNKEVGRLENAVGWYHSHPGYGCWLSGIDVSTQMLNQQFQEPWLAIVVDPVRTVAAGKVEVGGFRTYPEGYKPPQEAGGAYQSVPLDKIEDFGVHANQYYQLDMSFFKSSADTQMLDLLWSKYWINTLSSSSLVTNRGFIAGQLADLAEKLESADGQLGSRGGGEAFGMMAGMGKGSRSSGKGSALEKVAHDSSKAAAEQISGLITQVIKDVAFNRPILGAAALTAGGGTARAAPGGAGGAVAMEE